MPTPKYCEIINELENQKPPLDNITVQGYLDQRLRALAIDHLRNGTGEIVKNIRNMYQKEDHGGVDFENFLNNQAKNEVYAEVELLWALSELLGIRAVVKTVKDNREESTYEVGPAESQVTMNLTFYQHGDDPLDTRNHFAYDEQTQKFGNCLFDAFAQFLLEQSKIEQKQEEVIDIGEKGEEEVKKITPVPPANKEAMRVLEEKAIKSQEDIFRAAAAKAGRTNEKQVQSPVAEKKPLDKLDQSTLDQIAQDRKLAMKVAIWQVEGRDAGMDEKGIEEYVKGNIKEWQEEQKAKEKPEIPTPSL